MPRTFKLTDEVEQAICDAVAGGSSISRAAHGAQIHRRTLHRWIRRGCLGQSRRCRAFVMKLRLASEQCRKHACQGNSRKLARARYEWESSPAERRDMLHRELMRLIEAGRVEMDVARAALELASDEVEDRLAEESLSWAEDPALARTHGGDRGIADLSEEDVA